MAPRCVQNGIRVRDETCKVEDHVDGEHLAENSSSGNIPLMKSRRSSYQSFVTLVTVIAGVWLTIAAAGGGGSQSSLAAALPPEIIEVWRTLLRRPAGDSPKSRDPVADARVELGAVLFRDPRLSGPQDRSCASCHKPHLAFTDGRTRAEARDGSDALRNTPTIWSIRHARRFNWDGSQPTLEAQALGPIRSPLELNGDLQDAARRFSEDPALLAMFLAAYPRSEQVTPDLILAALSTYTRSLISPRTRFDDWVDGDDAALTAEEFAGFGLFVGKGRCATCHRGWRFTDDSLHDIGLEVAGDNARREFKTPTLRALTATAPYMHNGSMATLEEVIRHYSGGFIRRSSLAPNINRELKLTKTEIAQLAAFLRTLSAPEDTLN